MMILDYEFRFDTRWDFRIQSFYRQCKLMHWQRGKVRKPEPENNNNKKPPMIILPPEVYSTLIVFICPPFVSQI